MLRNKVMLQYHYIPLYKFKAFKGRYIKKNAELYYKTAISLPIYYRLSQTEQNLVIKLLIKYFANRYQ